MPAHGHHGHFGHPGHPGHGHPGWGGGGWGWGGDGWGGDYAVPVPVPVPMPMDEGECCDEDGNPLLDASGNPICPPDAEGNPACPGAEQASGDFYTGAVSRGGYRGGAGMPFGPGPWPTQYAAAPDVNNMGGGSGGDMGGF